MRRFNTVSSLLNLEVTQGDPGDVTIQTTPFYEFS